MSSSNQDLQATHQILSLLENSKSLTETLFDSLAGVFLIVDETATILRGNLETAKFFRIEHERLLGMSLSKLFQPQTWEVFQKNLSPVLSGTELKAEFELAIDGVSAPSKDHLWSIGVFPISTSVKLYSVIGKDISEFKRALGELLTVNKDLEVTRAVQTMLLPKRSEHSTSSLKLTSFYKSAAQSGGDWWWYDELPDGGLRVLVGDVTGHGAGSAMVTAAVASAYRTIHRMSGSVDLKTALEVLNSNLSSLEGDIWMTMSALEIHPAKNEFTWSNAGAPPIFILRADQRFESLVLSSSPLGSEPFQVATVTKPFQKGDRLFIFTDGVYELPMDTGAKFGRPGLKKIFTQTHGQSLDVARRAFSEMLEKFSKGQPLPDDASFVLIDKTT